MTNSEAAKCLEYIRFYMEGGECWTDAEFEAMDMAIEALRSATDINVATKEPEIILSGRLTAFAVLERGRANEVDCRS